MLVTGDIAATGAAAEYDVAGGWLKRICELPGAPDTALLTVPGNHDIDRNAIGDTQKDQRRQIIFEQSWKQPHLLDALIDKMLQTPDSLLPLQHYNKFAEAASC